MQDLLITHKRILLAKSPLCYDRPFTTESLQQDWQIRSGDWHIDEEWLTGCNPLNAPGMITSRKQYYGNILLDFEARTVLPSTHDIDWMWNGSWDEESNTRALSYIGGLQGWWEGKVGFEKSPDYQLTATTPLFPFIPGRIYHIQSGSIDGHAFIFVDNRLLLELTDPNPINNAVYGMIGFEAYASHIQLRNLKVRQISWQARELEYESEW